jgi:hypothetical protein
MKLDNYKWISKEGHIWKENQFILKQYLLK